MFAGQTRWYTFENREGAKGGGGKARHSRKGAPATPIALGESYTLADIQGSGTIRRIWMTAVHHKSPEVLRGVKIEVYWEDARRPAVQAPLGDFFCHSLGHAVPFENACFSSPEGRSFNCIVPMPFRKRARIVLKNESKQEHWVHYEVDATLGG